MPNNSSTGGYLAPASSPAPIEGSSFEDFLHDVIAGITGLDGTLVRPRWQPEPPNPPDVDVAWCAFGIIKRINDTYAYVTHDPGNDTTPGSDNLSRHQTLEILCSFYGLGAGSDADALADRFCDGLQIRQNREVMQLAGVGLVETGDPIPVPSLVKERWQYRVDVPLIIRREKYRNYPILNVASATLRLQAEEPDGHLAVDTIINVSQ